MATKRILVVDDEDDIREVAQMSLEMVGGWDVISAGSAAEALAKAIESHPDAILLDVMMPETDGPTCFGHLQANDLTRDIPVILLTARVQAADRRRFAELGVKGMIAKPFNPLTLASEIATTLGWTS